MLASPDGPLFASVSGLHRWVPWLLFIAFGLVALVALVLGWRTVHSAEQDLAYANAQLAFVNSELEATNARLERRAEELARSNAELDQFASIASHDLQEPLRKVRTFTEQLIASESEGLSERGVDYLTRANRAAERMQALIQDLLQFSRVTTKPRPFTTVDLNRVTAEILDDISVELEESNAEVSVGTLPTLSADELQMRQLILNLISNAVKFRREGVRPEITITRGDDWRSRPHHRHRQRHRLRAAVRAADLQGVRAPQRARRVPGYRDRAWRCARRSPTRHGDEIAAAGRLGHGAIFTVTLPLAHAERTSRPPDDDDLEPDVKETAHVAG